MDHAIKFYKESLSLNLTSAYVNLADIYLEEDEYLDLEKSKYYTDKAIQHHHYQAYYYLGKYYAEKNQFTEAKNPFEKLVEYGFYTSSEYGLSLLYYKYKNYENHNPTRAKEILEYMFNNRTEAERYSYIADFYAATTPYQNFDLAINYYEKGIEEGCLFSGVKLNSLKILQHEQV